MSELSSNPAFTAVPFPEGRTTGWLWRPVLWRAVALAFLFALELTSISVWLDDASLASKPGLAEFVRDWGAWILRVIVGFSALFGTFIWLKNKHGIERLDADLRATPVAWGLLAAHACAMVAFAVLSSLMFGGPPAATASSLLIPCWFLTGLAAIVSGALAFLPGFAWRRVTEGTGLLWVYALAAVIVACAAGNASRALWVPTSRVTFHIVQMMLAPFFSGIVADPATMILGTGRFSVTISPECSGFEGMGLITAFGAIWLFLFRKECRFPQALLLVPAGVILIFLLNSVRIAALIAIGDRGAERIALGGFHSQAGWIAFNAIALGLSAGARHIPWVTTSTPPRAPVAEPAENPTAAWVLPFVVILAVGMLSSAATADFEWLYPLRFFAAAATLWVFRRKYMALNWRVGWTGPAAGLAVFVIWILLDRSRSAGPEAIPPALAASQPWERISWVSLRTLAATVTVPVAEELAFRGFLLRRLVSPDFESVPFDRMSWIALLASSILFGLLHGERWLAGTVAGFLYALVLVRRGRIGEAVAAHATTNALIAVDVIVFHQWHLW